MMPCDLKFWAINKSSIYSLTVGTNKIALNYRIMQTDDRDVDNSTKRGPIIRHMSLHSYDLTRPRTAGSKWRCKQPQANRHQPQRIRVFASAVTNRQQLSLFKQTRCTVANMEFCLSHPPKATAHRKFVISSYMIPSIPHFSPLHHLLVLENPRKRPLQTD
jgi:hypothetical protein